MHKFLVDLLVKFPLHSFDLENLFSALFLQFITAARQTQDTIILSMLHSASIVLVTAFTSQLCRAFHILVVRKLVAHNLSRMTKFAVEYLVGAISVHVLLKVRFV